MFLKAYTGLSDRKLYEHPAVRLVQYPGEGHGNRRQPGRIDVLFRQMEWFDWYVRDLNPLDGPMPRLDISDRYGLDWGNWPGDSCKEP